MNKMREYERGREDGLLLARKIVKKDGLEGLMKEIKFRGATGIHTSLAAKDLGRASEQIREEVFVMILILGAASLHDCFGFGAKRILKWMDKMQEGAEYISDDLATWDDYKDEIASQLGITIRYERGNDGKNFIADDKKREETQRCRQNG